jgi:hypothetical protein
VARKKQVEISGQNSETTPIEEGSAPAGDLADAWLEEFSEELTWADLARWLSEAG